MPFLLFGALPFAIVCLLLWTPPVGAVPWIRTVYSVMVTQLYFLGYALVVTPYLALLPEIAGSTVQRLSVGPIMPPTKPPASTSEIAVGRYSGVEASAAAKR